MYQPGSPSKYHDKPLSKAKIQRLFINGVLLGLFCVFLWTCVRLSLNRAEVLDGDGSGIEGSKSKKRLLAFVGVQSGFSRPNAKPSYRYEIRRRVLRSTWFPSPQSELEKFERETGIRIRFMIGHSLDETLEANLDKEMRDHEDIVRLPITEDYLSLPYKILTFFKYVTESFDVSYIVKVDDDVYLRPTRLPQAISQWQAKGADYTGCMKRGAVFKQINQRWHEEQHAILGDSYYTHVWGCAYAVSGRVAKIFSGLPRGSLRFLNNEDTTIGSWMLAFNVTYFDDRRFCTTKCDDSSLVVFDYPTCAGLCDPQKSLVTLHEDDRCQTNNYEIELQDEIIKANTARSQRLPEDRFEKGDTLINYYQ